MDIVTVPKLTGTEETIVITIPERLKRRRYFKREARHVVFRNWYKLIFASLMITLIVVSVKYICGNFFALFDLSDGKMMKYAASYLTDIVFLAVIPPLIFGFYSYCKALSDNENPPFGTIFDLFGSVELLVKSYKIMYTFIWRYFTFAAIIYISLKITDKYAESIYIYAAALTAIFIFAVTGLIFLQRYYLTPFVAAQNDQMTVRESLKYGVSLMKGYKVDVLMFQIGFIGWWTVSFFTIGLIAVIYTIPYYFVANIEFAKFVYNIKENELNGEILYNEID